MPSRIVIIGGGMAGVSLAWWLARMGAGSSTQLVEREPLLGLHSTSQNAAILRTAIDTRATRHLAHETAGFLRSPPRGFSQTPLLRECGLVLSEGAPDSTPPPWSSDLQAWGEAIPIDIAEAQRLAPHYRPQGKRTWWLPRQGEIDVAHLLDGFSRGARAGGVEIIHGHSANEWLWEASTQSHGACAGPTLRGVKLDNGTVLEADRVVQANGAWAPDLPLKCGLQAPLEVTRRHIMVSAPSQQVSPNWPIIWDDQAGLYARPESAGMLISACDLTRVQADSLEPDESVHASLATKIERLLPSLGELGLAHFWPGLRTLSPDDAPLVGPDPRCEGLFWLAGLGGHGMSICAGVGRVAATMLLAPEQDQALASELAPLRRMPQAPAQSIPTCGT